MLARGNDICHTPLCAEPSPTASPLPCSPRRTGGPCAAFLPACSTYWSENTAVFAFLALEPGFSLFLRCLRPFFQSEERRQSHYWLRPNSSCLLWRLFQAKILGQNCPLSPLSHSCSMVPHISIIACWVAVSCHSMRLGHSLGQKWFDTICMSNVRSECLIGRSSVVSGEEMNEWVLGWTRKLHRNWKQCQQNRSLPSEQSLQSREEDKW